MTKTDTSISNPHNLQIGQSLFAVPTYGNPYSIIITKIGRKWAEYTKYGRTNRVDLKNLCVDGGQYSSPAKCYLSEQEYNDHEEKTAYWRELYKRLSYSTPPCKIETLKQIALMLGINI